MRRLPATILALFLATQGLQAFAAGRSFGHSGGRAHSGAHHFHSHSHVIVRPVRIVPRYVYVAPYVPYYATPYYSTPYYSTPAYYPPAYVEPPQPQQYAPEQQYAPAPPPPSQPSPYSMEEATQYRYLCLDTRKFYPDTKECPSGWLTVLPGARSPAR